MSKYEIVRLHRCDIHEYVGEAGKTDCEIYNKTLVELQFAHHSSGIRYSTLSSYNWKDAVDCARFDNDIVENGKRFNERLSVGAKPMDLQNLLHTQNFLLL
mmetsp:Transcript_23712/g.35174  ORF Transcript_23712/g.35174 Transcript_23712/m.35174 type:complete len:101 (+) Transcript_23712:193-495(+)